MKKRRLSILLSIVMLLSLLPTTALAAGNYPAANAVSVDGGKDFSSGSYYKNGNESNNFTGDASDYNAHYDSTTGTLTLNGYEGGSITAGGNKESKITVVLVGDNFINDGNLNSPYGGDITVTSGSSGGTLSITQTIYDSNNAAIGIKAGYGNYENGNVTITGSADVKIEVTHNGKNGNDNAYGIYAKENITISENASVDITCATPKNTTGGDHCNGLRADKNVIIDTTGTIKIDVKNAGKDANNGYSYGVYPMGTATLTKVGNMEVKWKKVANHSSFPGGAVYKKGTSLSDKDYAINEDETNCYASYRFGTPRTVMVENGALTGPGVPNARVSGSFLQGDKVNITPAIKKSWDDQEIPFKEWTSSDVTLDKSATMASNSFAVPSKDVTVTAKHSPFVGTPTFTPTGSTGSDGTLTFKTKVKADETYEGFRLVKEGNESSYISIRSDTTSTSSPYEYSYKTNRVSGVNKVDEGNYYVVAYLNNDYYLSEKFTVDYTAAPTVTYPDHVRVYNANGAITSLDDGQCLVTNDASATSYTSGAYVARYDSGTLYLNGYHGVAADDKIFAAGDLNIEIESNSSFTTSTTATNELYGIQADGKLNISGPGKLTVTATGSGDVYGIYADKGVTISAPLDVKVGETNETDKGSVYGIYTQSGAISLSGNDMTVTATGSNTQFAYGVYNNTQTSSTATGNGNIDISGTLTVNLSNGSYNRGISSQGGVITLDGATVNIPRNHYYGIYNDNGNVVIKSNSDVDISSDISGNNGICTYSGGDLTIQNSTVKVSANGLAANLQGNVSIKDSTIELTKTANHHEVIRTGNSSATITIDLSTEGSVTLTASGEQTDYAMITGNVTLGANTKLEKGKADGNSYDGAYDGSKTVLKFMSTAPATPIAAPTANTGLVYDGTEKTGVTESAGYTLTGTYKAIDVGTADYTATATLNPGFKWNDDSTGDKTITWNIGKKTPTATDFTFAPPADLTYDGNDKTASVTLNSSFTNSGAITVKYEKDGASVTETENVGTYTVKIDVAGGDNFNAGSNLNDPTWKFSIAPAAQSAPTTLGVEAPTASGGKGKIFGTTNKMEYNTNAAATSGWMACSATETEVAHGTYYVRYKADANHKAGAVATVTVPAYSETRYSITVNNDGHGTANANKTSAVAGETIILTATPNSGYVFGQWTDKTPDSLSIDPNGKFTMPGKNVSVKATFTKTSGGGSSSGGGGGGGGGGAAPATPQKPEIKPVTGGKVSLSADGTTATITPDAGKVVDKVLVNGKDMGAVTELKGLKTGDKIEILFKDEVKEPSKAETDKQVKAHMQKLAPKARSLKTKAGNVKVSFEGQFKDIEALGYTVKYKFYRSTKKASGYKHMLTTSKPSYTNTGGKKGTLYYYKAIALAYDKDGKLIAKTELKQCKYASRRWTK